MSQVINPFILGGGSPPPPSFTPADLFGSGEKGGWWDGADKSTMFQSNAGTTAVTTANDVVGYWGDKSGNGNHVRSTADDTTRPTYQTDGIDFDGSNDRLTATLPSDITDATLSVFVVFIQYTDVNDARIVSLAQSVGDNDWDDITCGILLGRLNTTDYGGYRTTLRSHYTAAANTRYLAESVWDGSDHIMTINENAATANANPQSFGADTLRFGAACATSDFADCRIAEVVVINRVLSSGELSDLRAYLNGKWSIY